MLAAHDCLQVVGRGFLLLWDTPLTLTMFLLEEC